jgi:DNA-directed RNA polymerase specialized sigma24 family protein
LTRESFEQLLSALDSDRAAAGEKYERLRIRLVRFFAWEGGTVPEDLADEALTRTATRLSQGEPIRDVTHYLLGVARLVIKEDRKKRLAAERAMAQLAQVPRVSPADEGFSQCLDQCLARLSVENRKLILRYYDGDKGNRIENRKKIAAELGLEINALRNRALRLREKLEECVRNCASDRGRDVSRDSDTSG